MRIAGRLCALALSLVAVSAPAQTPMQAPAAGRSTVSVEALWMWFKASPTPVPIITDYYLDDPSTQVLLGGGTMDTNPNPGFRITGAHGLDGGWGVEAVGFYVPSRSTSSGVSSSGKAGSTDLMLPFYDVTLGAENVTEISYSPEYAGSAQQTLSNDLWGIELNATRALAPQGPWRVDLVGGLRYLQLSEDYTITTSSPYIPPEPADIWNTTDRFDTTNGFWGLQVGARAAYDSASWVGGGTFKVALGSMRQQVSIDGNLVTNDYTNYGATQTFPGGYFALPTNIGNYSRNVFAVVPEVALSIGYRLTPAATVYVGYSFLYASDVARPGEQINRNINPTQTVSYGNDPPVSPAGPVQPTFSFNTTDFWAQSLTLGLAYRF